MSPPIPASIHVPLALWLIACAVLTVILLFLLHLHHNRQRRRAGVPTKTLAGHIATHAPHHLAALLVLAAGVAILAGVGVAYIVHHGGFQPRPGFHIAPPKRPPAIHAGGAGVFTTADLSARVAAIEVAQDQQSTLACCGLTVARLDEMNRTARGETALPIPLSGYRPWYYVTGGQNVGTTPDDEAAAYNAHGAEPLAYWGPSGVPDATDAGHITQVRGTAISWDYYVDSGGGPAGLNDIVWRLSHGTPVGIIWAVHHDGDAAQNVAYTWDGGGFFYEHCLTAVQYTSDFPGIGPAVKVWNTYGLKFGAAGYIWLPAAVVESHVQGAFVETPGPPVASWEPAPLPPAPTATPVIALPPTPPPTRMPAYWGVLTVRGGGSNLRTAPYGRILRGLPAGVRLRSLSVVSYQSPPWVLVTEHGTRGWVPVGAVVRSR